MDDCFRSISLFSGAMGLDLGLEQAGVEITIGQDIERSCTATMEANGRRGLPGDIRGIPAGELLAASGLQRGEPFLICGGPPCQPFSTAGRRMGINDPRGSLFRDYVRVIDAVRPRFFVMENVKGLLSAKLRDAGGQAAGTRVLDVILEEFQRLHYKTVYGLLDAVNYGAPQFRERFVMIGSRDGEDIFLPVPTHFHIHQSELCRWATLRQAIGDMEDGPAEYSPFGESRLRFLRMVPEGGNWRDLPPELREEAMGGAYRSGGGKAGFYRRLSYAQPSPTLVTTPIQKATMMCHPVLNRPLSVEEYARIQQFPAGWKIVGTTAEKYRQIGNAVPLGLARAIGEAVMAAARGDAEVRVKRMRGTSVHSRIQDAIRIGGGV